MAMPLNPWSGLKAAGLLKLAAMAALLLATVACAAPAPETRVALNDTRLPVKANQGQIPWEIITYLHDKYPPGYWKITKATMTVAVGPVFLDQEAYSVLNERQMGSGGMPGAPELMNPEWKLYSVNRYSLAARSRIMERMSRQPWARVHMLDDRAMKLMAHGGYNLEGLSGQGVEYVIDGTASSSGKGVTMHLRVVNTFDASIIAATSGQGPDIAAATDQALDKMMGILARAAAQRG